MTLYRISNCPKSKFRIVEIPNPCLRLKSILEKSTIKCPWRIQHSPIDCLDRKPKNQVDFKGYRFGIGNESCLIVLKSNPILPQPIFLIT